MATNTFTFRLLDCEKKIKHLNYLAVIWIAVTNSGVVVYANFNYCSVLVEALYQIFCQQWKEQGYMNPYMQAV